MNSLSTTHPLSNATRFKHLALALSIFYLLYNLTALYSASLYQGYPEKIHNLATVFDSAIPFIPAMIVPYSWSLVLFVVGFFLVRTSTQLSLLTHRLVLATAFACFIFYCYPAHFSYDRLLPDDWTRFGYQFLSLVDKPFNQLPSLHVSYAILLGVTLWNVIESKKLWVLRSYRLLLVSICFLIIISTILTYQHHLLDILGGLVLAGVVLIVSNISRNALITRYLVLGITGFLLIAIAGFYFAHSSLIVTTNFILVEDLAIAIAIYWLASFMALTWLCQYSKSARNKYWFQKNSRGKLTLIIWVKFAPIIIIYNLMSLLGQWYYAWVLRAEDLPEGRVIGLQPHSINNTEFVVASPLLIQTSLASYLLYWLSNIGLLGSSKLGRSPSVSVTEYQVIVVDLAAEISSHVDKLEDVYKTITTHSYRSHRLINTLHISTPSRFYVNYIYFPLLDLQPLNEILLKDYIDLFVGVDILKDAINHQPIKIDGEDETVNNMNPITLINFHCVMGLSRSIGVQVLYLVYCGKLTAFTYRAWIERHYPYAHLTEAYLPKSLVEDMVNYKYSQMSGPINTESVFNSGSDSGSEKITI